MTVNEVVPALLAACPTAGSAWQTHLDFWKGEMDRGLYNDAAVIAHHLVESFERDELLEFPSAFAVLERCLIEGDKEARDLATIGVIEDIQNIASHRHFGAGVFVAWLGPASRAAWDVVLGWWEQLAEAKAAGLLEPRPGQSTPPVVDPSDVQDPALRRMIEQLYRK
jgi:hypothetical protein